MVEAIILGLIQGLTEFLPVSSSGHLILARELFNINIENSLTFDIFLNTATLFAVIFALRGNLNAIYQDFKTEGFSQKSKKLIWAIFWGTIPAVVVGFLYMDQIEKFFRNSESVAIDLIIGSLIMLIADRVSKNRGGLTPIKGLVVGIFQALALIPGISRSGASISGGLFAGLSREEAIRFSFLLLIPVSVGALVNIFIQNGSQIFDSILNLNYFVAFLTALFSGIWSVKFLIRYLSKKSFGIFIAYRIILAIIIFIFI